MKKSKLIGTIRNDFMIVEKLVINGRSLYKTKCMVCGNEKEQFNITGRHMVHSEEKCKKTLLLNLIGREFGDYIVVDSKQENGECLISLKCNVCGAIRTDVAYRHINTFKNEHGKHCTIFALKDITPSIRKKLLRTYNNCKTRIRKGNEGNCKYKAYKGKEFGFTDSVDFIQYNLPLLIDGMKNFRLNDLTIDRIDTNVGYIKGNIRFVPQSYQQINKTTTYKYFIDEIEMYARDGVTDILDIDQRKLSKILIDNNNNAIINGKKVYRELIYKKDSVETIESR